MRGPDEAVRADPRRSGHCSYIEYSLLKCFREYEPCSDLLSYHDRKDNEKKYANRYGSQHKHLFVFRFFKKFTTSHG